MFLLTWLRNILIALIMSCVVLIQTNATLGNHITQVIIWGHKLHSHTHSYIHAAFYKAFNYLGYQTWWLDNNDDISSIELENTLFITEGQVDQNMPLRNNCYYVLHNCDPNKYQILLDSDHAIHLQVYAHKFRHNNIAEVEPFILYDIKAKTLYMPWATDLLPHEIEANKEKILNLPRKHEAVYIGTMWNGTYGNDERLLPFIKACHDDKVPFKATSGVNMDDNILLTQQALLAPAIQGKWQCEVGYIPCRIFKNISYGALGITNSETVYKLFQGKIVYNEDTYQLFFDAINRLKIWTQEEQYELMDFVKEKHTYLNRISHILRFFEKIDQKQGT